MSNLPRRRLQSPPHQQPPQEKSQSGSSGDNSFISFGEEAELSVVTQALKAADDIYCHPKPGELPIDERTDVTRLSMQQVGQCHQHFIGLYAFTNSQCAQVDAAWTAAEHRRKMRKQVLLLTGSKDGGRKAKKYMADAEAATDPELAKLEEQCMALAMKRDLLKKLAEGMQMKAEMYSREITRRQIERDLNIRRT